MRPALRPPGERVSRRAPAERGLPVFRGDAVGDGVVDELVAVLALDDARVRVAAREQALEDFNDPEGEFRDRDLYVFCVGPDDTMVAHPSVVGMDVTTLTDAEGQEIGNEIIRIGREEGGGSLDYRWENPTTGEIEDKSTYIEPVGEDVCAVGYYQES